MVLGFEIDMESQEVEKFRVFKFTKYMCVSRSQVNEFQEIFLEGVD